MPSGLSSAFLQALGKQYLYRVPTDKHFGKIIALGKKTYLPSAGNKTLDKQQQDTRQRIGSKKPSRVTAVNQGAGG